MFRLVVRCLISDTNTVAIFENPKIENLFYTVWSFINCVVLYPEVIIISSYIQGR